MTEYALDEALCEDAQVALYRARTSEGRRVLVKARKRGFAPAAEYASLRRELEAARQVGTDIAVEPERLDTIEGRPVLVLRDHGGVPLASLASAPLGVGRLLRLGVSLANALATLHARRIVHENFHPGEILVLSEDRVQLTGLAPVLTPAAPYGTPSMWPYLAPEQSGRLGLPVDHRSSLYSLGIILYQLLTGSLPFHADDLLGWIHAHVADAPPAPQPRAPAAPPILGDIVLRLLAKLPEDRYQSAAGLRHDLERCLEAWVRTGRVDRFPLGEADVPAPLRVPARIYGRTDDLARIEQALARVEHERASRTVLVAGAPGIGKSTLVDQFVREAGARGSFCGTGNCDPLDHCLPYCGIVQALESVLARVLEQSTEPVEALRARLEHELGLNASLLAASLPGLTHFIGPRAAPSPNGTSAAEAERRFVFALDQFMRALAAAGHVLVVVLEDLHWADPGTLGVLEHWAVAPGFERVLVIGTYRTTEVGPEHPLRELIDRATRAGAAPIRLELGPLSLDAVERWTADVLRTSPERVHALAQILHQRTGGNPLFVVRLLRAIAQDRRIHYAAEDRAWRFDLEGIRAEPYADNVAELIADHIRGLAPGTQEALRLFAAHGTRSDVATLAIVLDTSEHGALEQLEGAFTAGLIARVGGEVRFLHHRIHQVACELTPPDDRALTHRKIGLALLDRIPAELLAVHAREVAQHLDRAGALIASAEERVRAAEVDLLAGTRAIAVAHFAAALPFLASGIERLGEESWRDHHRLAFELHRSLARSLHSTGDHAAAAELCGAILSHELTRRERAEVYGLRADVALAQGRNEASVGDCLEALRAFGVEIPPHPTPEQIDAAYHATLARIGDRPIATLADLPATTDDDARAISDAMVATFVPAAYAEINLARYMVCVAVDRTLQHGTTGSSAVAFAGFGLLEANRYRRFPQAFALGELGYRLAQREESAAHRGRASFVFAALLSYLALPIRECTEILRVEAELAMSTGDHTSACLLRKHRVQFRLFAGDHLDDVAEEAARVHAFAESAGFGACRSAVATQQRLVARLQCATGDPLACGGLHEGLGASPFVVLRFLHYESELVARFMVGDIDGAVEAAQRGAPLALAAFGFLEVPDHRFYAALATALRCEPTPSPAREECLAALRADHELLRGLAASQPTTFRARAALVGAEIARLSGDEGAAERGYEEAIQYARLAGFVHIEGIASELASHFNRARGVSTMADAYLAYARGCYACWGARAKVGALERAHPKLTESALRATLGPDSLDLQEILKASQLVSSALVLPELHSRLLAVALEHANAQRGCLLLSPASGLTLAAAIGPDREAFGVIDRPADPARLPLSFVHTVERTRRASVLADATQPHRHTSDPYFASARPRSVLCLPIVREHQVTAVLYLENNLFPGAFPADRLGVLDVLASQAAISLENARLYTRLEKENAERRRAEESLEEQRAHLQAIIDNTPSVVFEKDPVGRYLLVNRRWSELFQIDSRDVIGKTDFHIFPRELAERMRETDARTLQENRVVEHDEPIRQQDGEHTYLTVKFPLREANGRPYAMCGIATDVTERKRSEEALRESLSLIEAAFESTTDGFLVVDREGRIVRSNRHFAAMWRVPDEVLARRSDAEVVASMLEQLEDPKSFVERVRALYAEPEASSHDTLHLHDGRVIERDSEPQRLGDRVVGRVWSFRDITERVQAERQRDRLLEQEMRARAEAEEAVRVRDEFLSIASHELRTPLTSLLLSVQALRQLGPGGATPPTAVVTVAERQVHRLTTLVGLMLDVSSIRRGRLELHRAPARLDAIVREVAALLAPEAARAGSELRVHASHPVTGVWDGQRIEQVVTNLLTNAIKFGRGEAIDLRVEEDAKSGVAKLTVQDRGIGISSEVQEHIFEPYQRGVSARHYGGLGLGLYVTRSIVEAHGGRVYASSEAGAGATFTVELPVGLSVSDRGASLAAPPPDLPPAGRAS